MVIFHSYVKLPEGITYLGQTAPSRTARYPLACPLHEAQVLLGLAPLLGGWLAPQRGLLRKFGHQVFQEIFGAQIVFLGLHLRFQYVPMYFRRVIFGCPNEAVDKHNHVNLRTLHMVIWSMSQENGVRVPQQQVICLEVIPVIPFRQCYMMLYDVTWSFLKEVLSVQMSPLRTCRALFVPLA
jgi:hypothetical protein